MLWGRDRYSNPVQMVVEGWLSFFFLVSQKAIVIQQAVSCVGISSPYSCVEFESDVNQKDFEVIL